MFFVYILFSKKLNRYYIGFTTNLNQRLDYHYNDTQARKFTYNADDWILVHSIECISKNQALAVEKHIKSMKSKVYIQNLQKYPEIQEKLLSKYNSWLLIRAPIAIGVGSSLKARSLSPMARICNPCPHSEKQKTRSN